MVFAEGADRCSNVYCKTAKMNDKKKKKVCPHAREMLCEILVQLSDTAYIITRRSHGILEKSVKVVKCNTVAGIL